MIFHWTVYIILDEPHLALYTGDGYYKINPASYQLTSRRGKKEEPMDLTPPREGEATPPLPVQSPPQLPPLPEEPYEAYTPPAVDRNKTSQYLDTVEEDLVIDD